MDEAGTDADGLSRDLYSAFWKEFFLTSACGEDERVPAIFPDYDRDKWEAVGRILTPDIMSESLRMYLCDTDQHVTDKALCGDGLDEDDKDDFFYLLSRVNCHSVPKH